MGAVSFFRAFASILAPILAALLAANQPAAGEELRSNNIDPTAIEKVDRFFEKWDKPNTPGAVLAIVKDGKIIYSRGYGMANLEEAVPNNSKTVFHLGSVSKQFTAFAIHLLVSDGKLSLDDDVRQYIQEVSRLCKTDNNSAASASYERPPRPMESSRFGRLASLGRNYGRRCSSHSHATKGAKFYTWRRNALQQQRV